MSEPNDPSRPAPEDPDSVDTPATGTPAVGGTPATDQPSPNSDQVPSGAEQPVEQPPPLPQMPPEPQQSAPPAMPEPQQSAPQAMPGDTGQPGDMPFPPGPGFTQQPGMPPGPPSQGNASTTVGPGAPSGGYSQPTQYLPPGGPSGLPPMPGQPQQATANVVLPPVKMPAAESRMVTNLVGSIVGLVLAAAGIILTLIFSRKIIGDDFTAQWWAITLTIVGALMIATPAVLSAWGSWTALVPGAALTGISVWCLVTPTSVNGGAATIDDAFTWLFDSGELARFLVDGTGLAVGLSLLAAGIAAVLLRAHVRRTVAHQLASIQ